MLWTDVDEIPPVLFVCATPIAAGDVDVLSATQDGDFLPVIGGDLLYDGSTWPIDHVLVWALVIKDARHRSILQPCLLNDRQQVTQGIHERLTL